MRSGKILTVKCRVGFLGTTAKIVVEPGGQLIFDGATLYNYATSDRTEAPQTLELLLGGDAADAGNNGGIIIFRNGGCLLKSGKLTAKLTAGATLHVEASAALTLDAAHLNTKPGSYLCIDAGAQVTVSAPGLLTTEPGTITGVGPYVGPISPPPSCTANLCAINATALTINRVMGGVPRVNALKRGWLNLRL